MLIRCWPVAKADDVPGAAHEMYGSLMSSIAETIGKDLQGVPEPDGVFIETKGMRKSLRYSMDLLQVTVVC
jgi:hypothetical protein